MPLWPTSKFDWSSEMILRSIEFLAEKEEYQRLPKKFFEQVKKIENIISTEELTKLIESTNVFGNIDIIMDSMVILREHAEFPRTIKLDGTINGMAASANSPDLFASNRDWLHVIAVKLFEYHKEFHPELPECAKYAAIFEADKLAKDLCYNICIHVDDKEIHRIVADSYNIADDLAHKLYHKKSRSYDDIQLVEDYVFDGRDYYMIPEYRQCLSADLENGKLPKLKNKALMWFAQVSEQFFHCLSNVTPFTQDSQVLAKIDFTARASSHLSLVADTVIIDKKLALPVLTPEFELAVPTSLAFYTWFNLFIEDYDSLDKIKIDKLDEVRSYINSCIDIFEPEKILLMDYDMYIELINECKKKKREYLKNPGEVAQFGEGFWSDTINKRFSGQLFPHYSHIVLGAICDWNVTPSTERLSKFLAFFVAFPKAAKLMHNQDACCMIPKKYGKRFCALDMLDASVDKTGRCGDVPLDQPFLEKMSRIRDFIKEQQDESSKPNAPELKEEEARNSEPGSSSNELNQSVEASLKGLKLQTEEVINQ